MKSEKRAHDSTDVTLVRQDRIESSEKMKGKKNKKNDKEFKNRKADDKKMAEQERKKLKAV